MSTRGRAATILVVLIAIAYGGSLWNGLVFDEAMFMKDDPRVRSLEQAPRLFVEPLWGYASEDGRRRSHQYYRPLQTFPLALSHAAFGNAAWPPHLLNLLLHFGNCLLVLGIFRHLLGREEPAFVATTLFAVHPAYSEAVLWVSDIAGLGAALCIMTIFLLHLSPRRERWYGWLLTPVLFLCGLWFKESGVLGAVLVGLYDLLGASDRGWGRVWRMRWRYCVFLPPFALYFALRVHALGGVVPGLDTGPLSGWEMALNAIALLPQYVWTFVWPLNLNMYHDFTTIHSAATWPVALGVLILAAGAVLCALTVRSHCTVAFGVVWTATATAPHLLIRWPQLNVFAERYLYLPAVGVFLCLGYVWLHLAPVRRRWAVASAATVVILFLIVDVRRTPDWRDEVTIYTKTLTQSARAEMIRTNLAVRFLELGRHDEGIALIEEVQRINPDWRGTWHNLGLLHLAKGQHGRAMAAFEEARARDPFKGATLLNLGYLYDKVGRREDALEMYFRLIDIEPENADGWHNLAVVAFELGQLDNARSATRRVLAISPDDAGARTLLKHITRAAARPPRATTARLATARRCEAAKRAVDEGLYNDAIIALEVAAWLDEAAAMPHHYLANVYVLKGRQGEAVTHQREALRRDPDNQLYRRNLAVLEQAAKERRADAGAPHREL